MSLEDKRRQALRARAHPLRLRMLSVLTGAAMSAAELGRELGISQALASYHLRSLVDAGAVELAEEINNRGGRERRYRYVAGRPDDPIGGGRSVDDDALLVTAALEELRRRQPDRDAAGPALMVDAELWVTDKQWASCHEALRAASQRLHDQAVRPRTPGSRPVSISVFSFAMADPRGDTAQ